MGEEDEVAPRKTRAVRTHATSGSISVSTPIAAGVEILIPTHHRSIGEKWRS